MAARIKTAERTTPEAPSPLPEKIVLVLQESRWLALVALAAFLGLALWGYQRTDPGWSHAVQSAALINPAGRGGAWIADLLLYVFGLSAWWTIVLLMAFVWWGYRRLDGVRAADRRPLYIALAGFLLLIAASSALESLRFYTLKAPLPLAPGGVVGIELGRLAVRYLGYTGATLTLIAAWALGWSIFSGMSWLSIVENLGALFENGFGAARALLDRRQDRRIGREVARDASRRLSAVRRWLTYLTLFIAASVLIGDLISLVNTLLGGELSARFALKTAVVALLAGGVFGWYLHDLRQEEDPA